MGKEQKIATWIFMILTDLRKRSGSARVVFLSVIKKYRIVYFLSEQYELLHYYDNDYIIDDIIRYIEEQGGTEGELRRAA